MNWEGRRRSFEMVIDRSNDMSDLRVLAALADALGTDLAFRTAAQARAELDELGSWDGDRIDAPDYPAGELAEPGSGAALLATCADGARRQSRTGR